MGGEPVVRGVGQARRKVNVGPLRLIHQRRQFDRQRPGAVRRAWRPVMALQPEDHLRQHRQTLRRLHRRRQVKRAGQRQRRLIQRAERHDPRQQQRLPAGDAQERVGQRARGAAGGQQDQPVGDRKGGGGAVQPVCRHRVQERHMRRDGKQVHRAVPRGRSAGLAQGQDRFGVRQIGRGGQVKPQPVMHHCPQAIGRHGARLPQQVH